MSGDPVARLSRGNLESWLRRQLPECENFEVSDLRPASSGSSNETQLFSIRYESEEQHEEKLVLRTVASGRGLFPKYDLMQQAQVMRALARTVIPVPHVRWLEPDTSILGSPFIVMDHVEGVVPSDTPPGFHGHGLFFDAPLESRVAMWRAVIEQLANLRRLNWRAIPLPPLVGMAGDMSHSMDAQIRQLEGWLTWAEAGRVPEIDTGMEWLRQNPPRATQLSLVWGDARPGNVLYRDGHVVCVLDWELATIGRPEFDLYYLIWQAEVTAEVNGVPRLSGLPDRDETIAMYAECCGAPPEDVQHAEMFTLVRLAVMIALGVRAAVHSQQSRPYLENNVVMRALRNMLAHV